ncbi:MAG: hypothetical protein JSS67_05940 [Bacteroidetes bacterium]|nr:hypothetical protein [Bacteroidota bacterium]
MSFIAAGAIIGIVGTGAQIATGIMQANKASEIDPQYQPFTPSPYAKMQLDIAQNMFYGRMEGAAELERNIANSQGNFNAAAERNATDSAQSLQLIGLSQGATNDAYNKLQIEEKQNKMQQLQNLNLAIAGMTSEDDKKYQAMLQKYAIDSQQKAALTTGAWGNIFGGLSNAAGGLINYGTYRQQNPTQPLAVNYPDQWDAGMGNTSGGSPH